MLQSLRIRNLALLDSVELEFEAGFTAVTGETGAGKSILLGALSLLAGERADKSAIRQGAETCEVEAALFFKDPALIDAILVELELPVCEDGQLLLRRSLSREKAPRITVNGSLATLSALQKLGEQWIDFHGPGEPRRLLRESCQLDLLDLYGRAAGALAGYSEAYENWRTLIAEREQLAGESALSPDQLDYLRTQLAAFDAVDLTEEGIELLERDFGRLDRAQELSGIAGALGEGLAGEDGIQRRVGELLRLARQLEALDPASRALAERLSSSAIELNDLGAEFQSLAESLEFDSETAAALTARMDAWLELQRRHGKDLNAVVAAREAMTSQLARQGDLAGSLARLDAKIASARQRLAEEARALRTLREKAGRDLSRVASRGIGELGFRKADFQIRIVALEEPGPTGDCRCEFHFSPNSGEPALPLNRIASSGELARVMLALKTVLADLDGIPVLVFDEVDANVGGEIGTVVGARLAAIGKGHQVLCVTHLPQVAAQAAHHLVVTKDQKKDRTIVSIDPIATDRKARVSELARMLGDRSAKSAIAHAEELLAR
jgi:DNA repair protein RecN (Recombination protein N)